MLTSSRQILFNPNKSPITVMPRKNKMKALRQNLLNLLAVMAIFIVITACVCRSDKEAGYNSSDEPASNQNIKTDTTAPISSEKSKDSKDKKTDSGDFTV